MSDDNLLNYGDPIKRGNFDPSEPNFLRFSDSSAVDRFREFLYSSNSDPDWKKFFLNLVHAKAESEFNKNQSIGESRAIQVLSMQDSLIREKNRKTGIPKKLKSQIPKFFWVTINPRQPDNRDDFDFKKFRNVVDRIYCKKWISKAAFVYEKSEKGNIHSHGIIMANQEQARAWSEIAKTLKAFDICDVMNTHAFKCINLNQDIDAVKQKIAYMKGNKKSAKTLGVELTHLWRKENNISEMYYVEGGSILVSPPEEVAWISHDS